MKKNEEYEIKRRLVTSDRVCALGSEIGGTPILLLLLSTKMIKVA